MWNKIISKMYVMFVLSLFEQNRALHDGLIYISASPLVAVLFFVYDYSNNISAKEKAL